MAEGLEAFKVTAGQTLWLQTVKEVAFRADAAFAKPEIYYVET